MAYTVLSLRDLEYDNRLAVAARYAKLLALPAAPMPNPKTPPSTSISSSLPRQPRTISLRRSSLSTLLKLFTMVYTLVCTLYTLDDPTCIQKVKTKLIEASRTYSKDKETLSWLVMQDVKDPRMFKVVERYQEESVSPGVS